MSVEGLSVPSDSELAKQPLLKMKNRRFSLQLPKTWSNLLFRARKKSENKFGSEVNLSQSSRSRAESYDSARPRKRAESLQHLPSGQSRLPVPATFDPFAGFTEFLGREVPPNSPDYGPSPAYGSQNSLNLEELPISEREVEFCPRLLATEQVGKDSPANAAGTPEINSKTSSPAKLRINQFFRPRSLSENKRPSLSLFLNKRRSSVAGTSSSTDTPTTVASLPAQPGLPSPPEKTESPSKAFGLISLVPKFRARSKSESRKSSSEASVTSLAEGVDNLPPSRAIPIIVVSPPEATPKQKVAKKSIYRQRSKSESRNSKKASGEGGTTGATRRRSSVGVDSQTKQDLEEVQRRHPPRRPKVAPPIAPSTKLNPTPITLQVLPEGVQVNHESPSTLPPESIVPTMPTVMELALSAIVVNVEPIVRRRSASIALGTKEPDPNLFASAQEFRSFRSRLEDVRKTARSALRRNESETDPALTRLNSETTLPEDNDIVTLRRRDSRRPRPRKSFSGDRATTMNFDRTKSRSVDQSLTAALDADVFGRFGSSNTSVSNNSRDEEETHAGPRPATPTGDRRSSGSGSTLKLPPEDTTMYTVQASDTLTSLAARFDITPSELAALNRLSSRLLFPGQVLYVPSKKEGSTEDVALAGGGRSTPTSPMNQSIEKELSLIVGTPPKETPQESAVLENIRAPGSPRICRRDPLASLWSSTQSAGQNSSTELEQLPHTEVPLTLEEERIQDREAYDKFLKINVRHITDGQGVVAGVLLVTPNALMFDPNVSDPLVIENGPEKYGVIAPLECVASAGLYPDIAHMRLSDVSPNKSLEVSKPDLYYPSECPLYLKYVLGAQTRESESPKLGTPLPGENPTDQPQESLDQVALQLSEAINDESDPTTAEDESPHDVFGEDPALGQTEPHVFQSPSRISALSRQLSETVNPLVANLNVAPPPSPREVALFALEEPGESRDTLSPVPGTSPNLATIIECVPETRSDDQEHVIRLEVKMDDADKATPSSASVSPRSTSPSKSLGRLGVKDTPPANNSASSAGSVEKMDPNEFKPRDPFSIPLIAPKPNNESSAGAPPLAAKKEASPSDKESTFTRSLEEKVAGTTDPIVIANQIRARHTSAGGNRSGGNALRGSRFMPVGSSDNNSQEGTPPNSSSPETRGQKMLKRLSYPLVWMGESFSSDKDPTANQTEQAPSESMFSRVFSSSPRSFVDFSSGLFSRAPEEVAKVRDLKEYGATAKILSDAGVRRASNTNDITARPGRAVPKVSPSAGTVPNKMGYRSMVSVEDVPELFASFDKLIPKPAQACEDPPLYLRIRMGKPLNKKISHSTPLMSYGKKKMRPEYWFSIPRDRADHLFRFFLLWTPNVYGEIDAAQAAERGFLLIEEDTELWDEPAETQVRNKVVRKRRPKKDGMKGKDGEEEDIEEDERGNDLGDIAKESWEIVSMNVYGSSLSSLELDNYLPELIGHSDILTDECRRQLAKRLPARAEGYPWTLVFSTAQHGFSLNSMYRKMAKVNSPILLVIEDTQGHVFGALTSCELRVSELFYGTGESYLFAFTPELKVFGWTGENTYFVKGNNESIAIGAGDGKFGLWLDGDLYQGRTQPCKTFGNDPLTPDEDFLVRALECWAFL